MRPHEAPQVNVAGIEETVTDKGYHKRRGGEADEGVRGAQLHSGEETKGAAELGGQSGGATSGVCEPAAGAGRVRQEFTAAFNLSLILRKLLGAGTPRELKNRAGEVFGRFLRFLLCLMTTVSPARRLVAAVGQPRVSALRCRMPRHRP